jgi:hypothetical protein
MPFNITGTGFAVSLTNEVEHLQANGMSYRLKQIGMYFRFLNWNSQVQVRVAASSSRSKF